MIELKPCPFCGGNPIIRSRYVHGCANRKHFKYECAICHASFNNWFKTEFKAAEFWNRRLNMTTADKLTYIQGQCLGKSCADCKLDIGTTCPRKNWNEWTDKEIEIAYSILILLPDSKELEFVKAGDSVSHPLHYTQNGIECIEAIKASMTSDGFMDYCKGNVLKYIWRWRDKGGVEDLEKARVYLNWMIEEAET